MKKRNLYLCYVAIILLSSIFYYKNKHTLFEELGQNPPRCFILQTQDKFKLLCRKYEQNLLTFGKKKKVKFREYAITWVAEPDLPVVSGCTESLALVKSAMSFRGPPSARCCR